MAVDLEVMTLAPRPQAHRPKVGESLRAPNMDKSHDAVSVLSTALANYTDEGDTYASVSGAIVLLGITGFGPTPGDGLVLCQSVYDVQGTPQPYQVLMPSTFYEVSRGVITYVYTSANQRTANDSVTNEIQFLQPSYLAGDVLMCVRVSGVWLDLNVDGRQWVADPP